MPKTRKLKTFLPDRKWRQLLNNKGFTRNYPFANSKLEPLKKKLLSIGGWAVCLPFVEEDYSALASDRGQRFPGRSQLFLGQPSQCHNNCADLWDQNKEKLKICTGYALSKDGVWRQHSWCYDIENRVVIETTVKRIQYFGFILNDIEADEFYWSNL
jgi:hypothetical protein